MCTRYTLVADAEKLSQRFNVAKSERAKPLYNAAPAEILPVVTQSAPEGLSFFYWGIPREWAQNKPVSHKLINAPVEHLFIKNTYRNSLEKRRCIVPADGFYTWKQVGKKTRIPYRFVKNDNSVFSFAGIWEEFENGENESYHTFMIITCIANTAVGTVDERMPVILTAEAEKQWLDKDASVEQLKNLLLPYPDDKIHGYTVSNRIDNAGDNSPLLIQPSNAVNQFGNYSLFD